MALCSLSGCRAAKPVGVHPHLTSPAAGEGLIEGRMEQNPHLTSPAAGEGLIEGRMEQNPTLTLPILGRGLIEGRMGMDVQPETRREIDSSPRMGEAGRG